MVSLSIIYQNHSQENGLARISGESRNYICWFRLPFLFCLLLRLRLRFQRLLLIRVTELCHPIILIGVLSWIAVSVLLQDSIPSNLMDQTPPTTDDQVSSEIASNMLQFLLGVSILLCRALFLRIVRKLKTKAGLNNLEKWLLTFNHFR
ncbi:hypothetical protein CDAR_617971 [Caerostris darwini]|uniref:Uncharacterized protein n=1 Tax=Caerostris darwini TaxID=1538125 RepID=A0AAV4TB89_9ARAC|nr:hypothetical protein CDAR_617971 [Caerostris darwini]